MMHFRRMMAVAATMLLVAAAMIAPAVAQTTAEDHTPYEGEEPETDVEGEAEEEEAVEEAVEEEVEEEATEEEVVVEEAAVVEETGTVLARTGVDAWLLALAGALVLGAGSFLLMRSRRGSTTA